MADKISFHFWTITDYEKEEQFLRDQHREGWSLRRYLLPGFYLFDRCEPRDMVYRLDFDQAAKWEKTEYLKMYRDYGWEYLFEVNGFSYFRKPSDGAEDEDIEIFSDNESRLEMIRRIFRRRMVPLLCICDTAAFHSKFLMDEGRICGFKGTYCYLLDTFCDVHISVCPLRDRDQKA